MRMHRCAPRLAILGAFACCAASAPAAAAQGPGWADALVLEPPVWYFGNYDLRLEVLATGALFSAKQAAGPLYASYSDSGAAGQLRAALRLQRLYDSGLITGARASFLVLHDALSGDHYGNDVLEKVYVYVQTGLGRVEIGQQDGAAYTVGITGPLVDPNLSLENSNTVLFRNPVSGKAFNDFSQDASVVNASSNSAKINYVSPRLFGVQIGASFTPDLVKGPVPWLTNPRNGPNVQASVWEVAASYTENAGGVQFGFSAAFARGALRNPTPGSADLSDWSIGFQLATNAGDVRISAGAALRSSSAYGFYSATVFDDHDTTRAHLSLMAERGNWRAGAEFSDTVLEAPSSAAGLNINGYQLAAGYRLNRNMQISAGWQRFKYARDSGVFYNGGGKIGMSGGFLTLGYAL